MLKWIQSYRQAKYETKAFVIVNLLFALAILITTLYCYGRLDFVRSYDTSTTNSQTK